jgi:acetyltransferase-like isoleucine patch superfamily enzyme
LTTFGGAHLAATEDHSKIDIGNDCMLASGIDIRTGDSHAIFDGFGQRINEAQDVIIGDHVWVAARATILKGAIIGPGSIVGTGAVVTNGNYPAQSILAGNPVKLVRQNIQWTRSRRK